MGAGGPEGAVRVRHILFRHQQLKQPDPMMRREGTAAGAPEAEKAALDVLEKLLTKAALFPSLCREHSDCQSADQPGNLTGDLGWLARGQSEQTPEESVFTLGLNEFSDILSSTRGVHIFQRLA